jgi:hypothetical protein
MLPHESEIWEVTNRGRKKIEEAELYLLRSIGNCKITLLDYKACEEIRHVLVPQPEDAWEQDTKHNVCTGDGGNNTPEKTYNEELNNLYSSPETVSKGSSWRMKWEWNLLAHAWESWEMHILFYSKA